MTYNQKKFLKSLAWNILGMSLAFSLDQLGKNLGIFNLSPEMTALLGIIISRLTKVWNVYVQSHKELE